MAVSGMTMPDAVALVCLALEQMRGGEVFVPAVGGAPILDLARAIVEVAGTYTPGHREIGLRPGEKIHEVMVPEDEAWHTLEFEDHYVIQPTQPWWTAEDPLKDSGGSPCPDGFAYSSGENSEWLSVAELEVLVANLDAGD